MSDLVEWNIVFNEQGEAEADHVDHPFAVIVTQDCDLEQDHRARTDPEMKPQQRENGILAHVLVVVAADFEASKEKFAGSDVRKRARQNKDERYQFLAPGGPTEDLLGLGFPSPHSGLQACLLGARRTTSPCRTAGGDETPWRSRRALPRTPRRAVRLLPPARRPLQRSPRRRSSWNRCSRMNGCPSLYATTWSNPLDIEISLSD